MHVGMNTLSLCAHLHQEMLSATKVNFATSIVTFDYDISSDNKLSQTAWFNINWESKAHSFPWQLTVSEERKLLTHDGIWNTTLNHKWNAPLKLFIINFLYIFFSDSKIHRGNWLLTGRKAENTNLLLLSIIDRCTAKHHIILSYHKRP